jgi:hypothetical protein
MVGAQVEGLSLSSTPGSIRSSIDCDGESVSLALQQTGAVLLIRGQDSMPRYVVTYAASEDSGLGEASRLATTISGVSPEAEPQPEGVWFIQSDVTADAILATLSEGVSEECLMICEIPPS